MELCASYTLILLLKGLWKQFHAPQTKTSRAGLLFYESSMCQQHACLPFIGVR